MTSDLSTDENALEAEKRIYHVVGHVLIAMSAGFPIELLALNGFAEADLTRLSPRVQRLDEWTMIHVPDLRYPPGTIYHSLRMENLCQIALAGPISELRHRGESCSVSAIQEHVHDWRQAWTAAGFLRRDETDRMSFVERQIFITHRFLGLRCWQEYIDPLVRHLSTHGSMEGTQIQAIWDRIAAEHEARSRRPISRRLLEMYSDETYEE